MCCNDSRTSQLLIYTLLNCCQTKKHTRPSRVSPELFSNLSEQAHFQLQVLNISGNTSETCSQRDLLLLFSQCLWRGFRVLLLTWQCPTLQCAPITLVVFPKRAQLIGPTSCWLVCEHGPNTPLYATLQTISIF